MKNQVTVIPIDNVIIVDGKGLRFEFDADANIHAVQWFNGSGHVEFKDVTENKEAIYADDVEPFVLLWEEEWARVNAPLPEPTLEELKASKLIEINAEYTKQAQLVKLGTPDDEVLTWDIQRLEAQAWQANNVVPTPNVDVLASSRGVDRVVLLEKILEKVTSYEAYIFELTGKRQKYEDQIKAATTKEQVEAIVWA